MSVVPFRRPGPPAVSASVPVARPAAVPVLIAHRPAEPAPGPLAECRPAKGSDPMVAVLPAVLGLLAGFVLALGFLFAALLP